MTIKRANFTAGVEVIIQDLNRISSLLEKNLYDRAVSALTQIDKRPGGETAWYIDNAFFCERTDSDTITVKAGLGFQKVTGGDASEPEIRPLYLDSDHTIDFVAPASNPRIDLICVRADSLDADSENRRTKASEFSAIVEESRATAKAWTPTFNVVEGTPAAAPTAPSVPSGYVVIAEVTVDDSTTITNQAAISDERIQLSDLWRDFEEEGTASNIESPKSGNSRLWLADDLRIHVKNSSGAIRRQGANRLHTVTDANYTILTNDGYDTILVSTGSSNRTINLPSASENEGRKIHVMKTDTGSGIVLLTPTGGAAIYPDATAGAARAMHTQYMYFEVISDGTNWFVMSEGEETGTVDVSSAGDFTGGTLRLTRRGLFLGLEFDAVSWTSPVASSIASTGSGSLPLWFTVGVQFRTLSCAHIAVAPSRLLEFQMIGRELLVEHKLMSDGSIHNNSTVSNFRGQLAFYTDTRI